MKKTFNLFDFLLVILILTLTFWIPRYIVGKKQTLTAHSRQFFLKIIQDGKNTEFIPLPADNDEKHYHYVKPGFKIEITSYSVRVAESDCPRKICKHSGKITIDGADNEVIVCVPNKIILKVVRDKEDRISSLEKYDSITR